MQALRQDLAKLPMVESAQLDTEWMQTLYQIAISSKKCWPSCPLPSAWPSFWWRTTPSGCKILSRKEEIEITKLLGAPSSFIRRPFLYQAVWQSLLAAGLSLALCAWLIHATQPLVAQIFRPYGLTSNGVSSTHGNGCPSAASSPPSASPAHGWPHGNTCSALKPNADTQAV